jgi:hypothetical protein
MFRHRLIATQGNAGLSLRNVGALLGGQLLYLSPFFVWALIRVGIALFQGPATASSRFIKLITFVPLAPLTMLALWSPVAEPHWLAPAFLGLGVAAGNVELSGRLRWACVISGLVVLVFAWCWVRTPLPVAALGESYRPRYDLANDLYVWRPTSETLVEAVEQVQARSSAPPFVIGPHWIVCAQAEVVLAQHAKSTPHAAAPPVACREPIESDYQGWVPSERWERAPHLLFVQDDRFEVNVALEFPDYQARNIWRSTVQRGGRVVRTVRITWLERSTGTAERPRPR